MGMRNSINLVAAKLCDIANELVKWLLIATAGNNDTFDLHADSTVALTLIDGNKAQVTNITTVKQSLVLSKIIILSLVLEARCKVLR